MNTHLIDGESDDEYFHMEKGTFFLWGFLVGMFLFGMLYNQRNGYFLFEGNDGGCGNNIFYNRIVYDAVPSISKLASA